MSINRLLHVSLQQCFMIRQATWSVAGDCQLNLLPKPFDRSAHDARHKAARANDNASAYLTIFTTYKRTIVGYVVSPVARKLDIRGTASSLGRLGRNYPRLFECVECVSTSSPDTSPTACVSIWSNCMLTCHLTRKERLRCAGVHEVGE